MNDVPYDLDVRPIFEQGGDPFSAIMAAVAALTAGQPLRLLVPFKPIPLFQVMETRGFDASASETDDGNWEVIFTPTQPLLPPNASGVSGADPDLHQPDVELDLRDLDPPEPMIEVLEQVERLSAERSVAALLPREPVFLFEELRARGCQWRGAPLPDGGYRIVIRSSIAERNDA